MFKSTVKYNEDTARKVSKATTPLALKVILIFICAAYIYYATDRFIYGYLSGRLPYSGILFLFQVAFFALLLTISRSIRVKRFVKRAKELYGVPEETFSSEFDDVCVISRNLSSGAQAKIPYESLKKCYETDDLIILATKARQAVLVSKAEVDKDELFAFLRSKPTAIKKLK